MKPHTRQTLDDLTGLAVARGFRAQRRGFAWRLADGDADLKQAIAWQPREWPDGLLWVHVFRMIIWEPLEQQMARGFGLRYRLGSSVTTSDFINVARPLTFAPWQDPAGEMAGADDMLTSEVIPGFAAIGNKAAVQARIAAEVSDGHGYPEKLLLATLLTEGDAAAEASFGPLRASLSDFDRGRLDGFWALLRQQ